jgi:hypothetical protein
MSYSKIYCKLKLCTIVWFITLNLNAQSIYTIAGTGIQGYSGDNILATSSEICNVIGIDVDNAGNIYLADGCSNRVRRVDAVTGIITTVAGNGTEGYSGDGGQALSAQLDYPADVALDDSGNIYIADADNHCIRKVSFQTGIITTIAGTGALGDSGDGVPATGAAMIYPMGVAVDSAFNVYIATNRVRIIIASTGIISTIAGTQTPGFSGDGGLSVNAQVWTPSDVVVAKNGDIYFSDGSNRRIRKIERTTGIINTVAGNGTNAASPDGGLATQSSLYGADNIDIDSAGNIYFSERLGHRVREVKKSDSTLVTVAGTGVPGFSGDWGPALSAQLYIPRGVLVVPGGDIYVSDNNNNRIRKISVVPGVNENRNELNTTFFPNPVSTTGIFQITGIHEMLTTTVYDQFGRVVWITQSNESQVEFDARRFCSGIYYYRIEENGVIKATGKLVIEQ